VVSAGGDHSARQASDEDAREIATWETRRLAAAAHDEAIPERTLATVLFTDIVDSTASAARVAAAAQPGEVLASSIVRDLVAGSGLEFEERGSHVLKGVPGEWRLFAARGTPL
jgi:class 3 adenylate cyclase